MSKEISRVNISSELLNMVQAIYEDYRSKQDILTMLFDIHKYDEDSSLIESIPFKTYEKLFMEKKLEYDLVMQKVQEECIPEEFKKEGYRFEIDFEEKNIKILK